MHPLDMERMPVVSFNFPYKIIGPVWEYSFSTRGFLPPVAQKIAQNWR